MIVENTNGLYRCEAKFGNWGKNDSNTGFLYFDRSVLDFGKTFEGQARRRHALRRPDHGTRGAISRRAVAATITVLAEDRFQDLRMTRRTRTFADVSDADVIRQIATDHGLHPSVDVRADAQSARAGEPERPGVPARARARDRRRSLWMEDNDAERASARRAATAARCSMTLRQPAARVHRARRPRRCSARASRSAAGTSRASRRCR